MSPRLRFEIRDIFIASAGTAYAQNSVALLSSVLYATAGILRSADLKMSPGTTIPLVITVLNKKKSTTTKGQFSISLKFFNM
jgi:hypothetical protein